MNLFIDTNVYLTFYHFSSDDLEELRKLCVAIDNNEISLFITEQVINEFDRNREARISDALKRFNEQKLGSQFPQICKGYPEFNELQESLNKFEKAKDQIMEKLKNDIVNRRLGADIVISELFAKGETLSIDEKILEKAKTRSEFGNPPGKINSYGDAINWELLLSKLPMEQDLYLITDDKDYISPVDENRLADFLVDEWGNNKNARIFLYRKLSDFFRVKYPRIKLARELERELAVSRLVNSGSFRRTHSAIQRLSSFSDFTDAEINEIVKAYVFNSQISSVIEDEDVKEFIKGLISERAEIIKPELLGLLGELMHNSAEEENHT